MPTSPHPKPSSTAPTSPQPLSPEADGGSNRVRGRLMAQSLMLLLDRVRGARDVLPHLAALERGLLQHGVAAIGQVPPLALTRMCTQLSSLPIPPDDPPLHDLLNRLLAALAAQRQAQFGDPDTVADHMVVVREITHSQYDAATAGMATTTHGDI